MNQLDILEKIYKQSLEKYAEKIFDAEISSKLQKMICDLAKNAENSKAVVTVLITLLVQKIFDPNQDIRYHQAQLQNGFSGRSVDTEFVTPFMKGVNFPAMAESGWMTHSLAEPYPYDFNYQGKIRPKELRTIFLTLVDAVQNQNVAADKILIFLFLQLIELREKFKIAIAKPHSLSISQIIEALRSHWSQKYDCQGAARLPVLAVYAAYQCMMGEVARYEGKILCPLESHSSADMQSGRIGDIDVNNSEGTAFEGVEIKHGKPITTQLVADAYEKFKVCSADRYYLLTTADMTNADWGGINDEIGRVARIHGCQVIVNGVYSTLAYYLRLLRNSADFIDKYVDLLKVDESVKYEHKSAWNAIVAEM